MSHSGPKGPHSGPNHPETARAVQGANSDPSQELSEEDQVVKDMHLQSNKIRLQMMKDFVAACAQHDTTLGQTLADLVLVPKSRAEKRSALKLLGEFMPAAEKVSPLKNKSQVRERAKSPRPAELPIRRSDPAKVVSLNGE